MPFQIAQLLDTEEGSKAIIAALRQRPNDAEWLDFMRIVGAIPARELNWLSTDEQASVRNAVCLAVCEGLAEYWPNHEIPDLELESTLSDFIDWLSARSDLAVIRFCWPILKAEQARATKNRTLPIQWLSRPGTDLSFPNLKYAIAIEAEVSNIQNWPRQRWREANWERETAPYFRATTHPSYTVRSWAAKAIAELHEGIQGNGGAAPSNIEMLEWAGPLELVAPGVASGLFSRGDWSFGLPMPGVSDEFLRQWLLDVLGNSGPSPYVPGIVPLEIYAEEFFAFDPEGIEELTRRGRADVAAMAEAERDFLLSYEKEES